MIALRKRAGVSNSRRLPCVARREIYERRNEEGCRGDRGGEAGARLGARSAACDPVMRRLIDTNPNLDYNAWRRTLPVEGLFEALLFQIDARLILADDPAYLAPD